jgi:trypsin
LNRCTLAYIFRDKRKRLYVITAGHCTQRLGQTMFSERNTAFGTVVYRVTKGTDDVALILITPSHYGEVQPAVRVWGGPTGYTMPRDVHRGDEILFTGDSYVLGDVSATSARNGYLLSQDARHFSADTSASEGDSGGPFLIAKTGRALGIVWDFGTEESPPSTDAGPTIQRILALFSRAGWRLSLVTAPYHPPS